MTLALSVLDQIPVREGSSAAAALAETLSLAELADRLGYRRYWLAEHHDSPALACASPETLLPLLAERTRRIRVGAGGVMLSHYSPFKVAETFALLETLYPGRIDLGLGRAPGSDRLTAAALAYGMPRGPELYPSQVSDLIGFLAGTLPPAHPFRGIRPGPAGHRMPELWLLGSGVDSALLAARLGCAYSHAHFINPRSTGEAVALYSAEFAPGVITAPRASIGISAVCADTDEEAELLSRSRFLWWIKLTRGQPGPIPTLAEAIRFPYTEEERATIDRLRRRSFLGAPAALRARLQELAAEHRVDELVVLTITHEAAARRRSYELLAEAFSLEGAGATAETTAHSRR
ncbi:MAG TPA: LLM class flavin-dependent oxidoreductase [Thermoanaerobaculia bacterium]|nr:LLM class flavin-dependent oxidoreductase [Thermoanaerobaculia bacterium]